MRWMMAVTVTRLLRCIPASAIVLAGCTTTPPAQDPVLLRVTDMEARLIRIERVIENQSLIELATQLDQLQTQTQELRGEVETLRFESENAGNRQRQLYLDVDQRLQAIEQGQARLLEPPPVAVIDPADARAVQAVERPVVSGSDQDNYQAAFELLKNGRYEQSAEAFRQFLVVFPSSPLADNAQYWLAETYYVQRQFTTALPAFQVVVDSYPNSIKLPDALLKIGFCNYELRQFAEARTALERVVREFPDTTAARLATQRLERIAQEQG
ncbi:MAG TPA: tol-pal system protein YbgF [Gammaproteobacteria bacterium]|nr:tol-pal system protein YbgF [Gammaproteobacteria bacterium]